jgi:hypothetical protein
VRPAVGRGGREIFRRGIVDDLVQVGDDTLLAELRFLLQMARFTPAELANPAVRKAEGCRVLERIRREQQGFAHWHQGPGEKVLALGGAFVTVVADDVARAICQKFHYIGTPREGVALGLYRSASAVEEPPSTLLVFSRFDLERHYRALPPPCSPDNVLVLSRVYSFRWAPRNAFSYCFRRALRFLRDVFPSLAMVLTYVNPNLGFTATSYLAANWLFFSEEATTSYDYLDGDYITRRELQRRFGYAALGELKTLLSERLTHSRLPLAPLQLWCYPLRRSLRQLLPARRRFGESL